MPPFTRKRKKSKKKKKPVPKNYNHEVATLVMAKKLGLSFEELNMFTASDFMDFIDIYLDEVEGDIEATQEDIDKFYSSM